MRHSERDKIAGVPTQELRDTVRVREQASVAGIWKCPARVAQIQVKELLIEKIRQEITNHAKAGRFV